jgi:hypothetical protein
VAFVEAITFLTFYASPERSEGLQESFRIFSLPIHFLIYYSTSNEASASIIIKASPEAGRGASNEASASIIIKASPEAGRGAFLHLLYLIFGPIMFHLSFLIIRNLQELLQLF